MTIKEKIQDLKDKDTKEKNKIEKLCCDNVLYFYKNIKILNMMERKIQCENFK